MADKTVFWADPERTFGDGLGFGDEVTGMIDKERQEAWLEDGTLSEEKPESVAHASQNKLAALEIKVEDQASLIDSLKAELKNQPKNLTAANKEIKKLEKELKELQESRIKAPAKTGAK